MIDNFSQTTIASSADNLLNLILSWRSTFYERRLFLSTETSVESIDELNNRVSKTIVKYIDYKNSLFIDSATIRNDYF